MEETGSCSEHGITRRDGCYDHLRSPTQPHGTGNADLEFACYLGPEMKELDPLEREGSKRIRRRPRITSGRFPWVLAGIALLPAAFVYHMGIWLAIVNDMGRTLEGPLISTIPCCLVVWVLAVEVMRRPWGAGATVRWAWTVFACAGIGILDAEGVMAQGGFSGRWVLHYVLFALAGCLPLAIAWLRSQRPRPWTRFAPLLTIVASAVILTQVTISDDDAFGHHVANCHIGMTGDAWLEEFAGYDITVYNPAHQRARASQIVTPSWEGRIELSPDPGLGGSSFVFEDGALVSASINFD